MAAAVENYTKAGDDAWVVIRFVDELKVTAVLIGPSYSKNDLAKSASRIWRRYFGVSIVPISFFERLLPLMKAAASSRSIVIDGQLFKSFHAQPCYLFGDDALYELVAINMFQRWFGDCPPFSIAFEYMELAGTGPPDLFAVYQPAFPVEVIILFFFSLYSLSLYLFLIYLITVIVHIFVTITMFCLIFLLDPGDHWYWCTQEASTENLVQPPGFRLSRGQRCLAAPPVSRAAESIDGEPPVIERLMDIGLFYQYPYVSFLFLDCFPTYSSVALTCYLC